MYEQSHEDHNSMQVDRSAGEKDRVHLLKDLVETHHLLSQYQGAFKALHTFIAGLTLQKHPTPYHKPMPGEIIAGCYVCEAQTIYWKFQKLGEACEAKLSPSPTSER